MKKFCLVIAVAASVGLTALDPTRAEAATIPGDVEITYTTEYGLPSPLYFNASHGLPSTATEVIGGTVTSAAPQAEKISRFGQITTEGGGLKATTGRIYAPFAETSTVSFSNLSSTDTYLVDLDATFIEYISGDDLTDGLIRDFYGTMSTQFTPFPVLGMLEGSLTVKDTHFFTWFDPTEVVTIWEPNKVDLFYTKRTRRLERLDCDAGYLAACRTGGTYVYDLVLTLQPGETLEFFIDRRARIIGDGKFQSDYAFTVSSVTRVSEVPLPAGGWALLTGLAGFVALRRRRKA